MRYEKAVERIRSGLMKDPVMAERMKNAEKRAQEELDRQDTTKGRYRVLAALPKSLSDDHLNVCLAGGLDMAGREEKVFAAWTSLNTSLGGLNHGHYDCNAEEACRILFDAMDDGVKKSVDWMDRPGEELARLMKEYCETAPLESGFVGSGSWKIRDGYEPNTKEALGAEENLPGTKSNFDLFRENSDGFCVKVGRCEDGMLEFLSGGREQAALDEIVSLETEKDLAEAVIAASEKSGGAHLECPLLIDGAEIESAARKAAEEEAGRGGVIEIYADYSDEMDKSTAIEILGEKDPQYCFFEKMNDWYHEEEWRIQEEIASRTKKILAEKHPGLEKTEWYYGDGEDMIRDAVTNTANITYPEDHFLDQEFNVNIYLDSGNSQTDFGDDVLPGHCEYGMYYRSGQDKSAPVTLSEAMENIPETSSILWLAKQQGYTKDQLARALISEEKTGDKFLDSVRTELENAPYGNNTLVFLTRMTLRQLMEMSGAMNDPLRDGSVTLPKGTECGLFNYDNGSGSVLEIETMKDIKIPAENIFTCMPDGYRHYDVNEVYGLVGSVWNNPPLAVESRDREITCKNFAGTLGRLFDRKDVVRAGKNWLKDGIGKPLDAMELYLRETQLVSRMSGEEKKKYRECLERQGIDPDETHTDFLQELATGERSLMPPSMVREKSVTAENHFDMEKEIEDMAAAKKTRDKEKQAEIGIQEKAIPQRTIGAPSRGNEFGRGL